MNYECLLMTARDRGDISSPSRGCARRRRHGGGSRGEGTNETVWSVRLFLFIPQKVWRPDAKSHLKTIQY